MKWEGSKSTQNMLEKEGKKKNHSILYSHIYDGLVLVFI